MLFTSLFFCARHPIHTTLTVVFAHLLLFVMCCEYIYLPTKYIVFHFLKFIKNVILHAIFGDFLFSLTILLFRFILTLCITVVQFFIVSYFTVTNEIIYFIIDGIWFVFDIINIAVFNISVCPLVYMRLTLLSLKILNFFFYLVIFSHTST